MACYLHSVPGRMRVKAPSFRKDPALAVQELMQRELKSEQ